MKISICFVSFLLASGPNPVVSLEEAETCTPGPDGTCAAESGTDSGVDKSFQLQKKIRIQRDELEEHAEDEQDQEFQELEEQEHEGNVEHEDDEDNEEDEEDEEPEEQETKDQRSSEVSELQEDINRSSSRWDPIADAVAKAAASIAAAAAEAESGVKVPAYKFAGKGVAGGSEQWNVGGKKGHGAQACFEAVMVASQCQKDYFTYVERGDKNCGCKGSSGGLSVRGDNRADAYKIELLGDYLLHLVSGCYECSTCRTPVKLFGSTDCTGNAIWNGNKNAVASSENDAIGLRRRISCRRRRTCRRRRSAFGPIAQSMKVSPGCEVQAYNSDNPSNILRYYPPGDYHYDPWRNGPFVDEGKYVKVSGQNLKVADYAALCHITYYVSNAGVRYQMGQPLTEWGCNRLSSTPTIIKDTSTGLLYVGESTGAVAAPHADDALPATTTLSTADRATCKGFDPGFDQCISGKGELARLEKFLDSETSSIPILNDLAMPVIRQLIWLGTTTYVGNLFNQANFCLGTWTGKQLKTATTELGALQADGCHVPPNNENNTYTVLSMKVPVAALNMVSLCKNADANKFATFCLIYTGCANSQPTFAYVANGETLGCFFTNDGVAASSAGLGHLVGQAASFSLAGISWGLSLTGEFRQEVEIFDGQVKTAVIYGNTYRYVSIGSKALFPASVDKYLAATGNVLTVFQIGDGSISQHGKDLFSSNDPDAIIDTIISGAAAVKFDITLKVKLAKMTSNVLPDMNLGSLSSTYGLVTLDTLPESGVLPGFYLYQHNKCDLMGIVLTYAKDSLSSVINKIAGSTVSGLVNKLFDCFGSMPNNAPESEFGIYLNTNSFGFMVTLPLSTALLSFFPLGGIFGSGALGTVELSCKVRFTTGGVTCAVGYDAPKWISALFDGVMYVVGAIADTLEAAEEFIVNAFGGLAGDLLQVGGEVVEWVDDIGGKVAGEVADVAGKAAKEVAKFGSDVGDAFEDAFKAVGKFFSPRRRRRRII